MSIETVITENMDKYVHVQADCIPVKGAKNAAIYDTTRGDIISFPSSYFEVLGLFKNEKLGGLLDQIETEEEKGYFMDFMEFLITNEFIIFLDDPSMFPAINDDWDAPCMIQNAIIDVDEIFHDFDKIFQELDALGCEFVQLRSFSNLLKMQDLEGILSLSYHKSIRGLELLLKYDPAIEEGQYVKFLENQPIIADLTIHSSPVEKETIADFGYQGPLNSFIEKKIYFITDVISSHHHCGIIAPENFSAVSVNSFFENKRHNGCLNRKVSVDTLGEIKNCPSMDVSFGNIKENSLNDVVSNINFNGKWEITKDQIETCKDCEFRYSCTDCRAYIETPKNVYSKPLKCGYDPYTGEWKEWSTNPLKQKAIRHYKLYELV